jgi:hypothetical protein
MQSKHEKEPTSYSGFTDIQDSYYYIAGALIWPLEDGSRVM